MFALTQRGSAGSHHSGANIYAVGLAERNNILEQLQRQVVFVIMKITFAPAMAKSVMPFY